MSDEQKMVWPLQKGLTRDQARNIFIEKVKPRTLTFERFRYSPLTGLVETWGNKTADA